MTGHQIYNNTVLENRTGIIMQGRMRVRPAEDARTTSSRTILPMTPPAVIFRPMPAARIRASMARETSIPTMLLGWRPRTSLLWGNTTYSAYRDWEVGSGNCGTIGCTHSMESDPMSTDPSGGVLACNPAPRLSRRVLRELIWELSSLQLATLQLGRPHGPRYRLLR